MPRRRGQKRRFGAIFFPRNVRGRYEQYYTANYKFEAATHLAGWCWAPLRLLSDTGTLPGGRLDLSHKSVATKIGGEYCRQSGKKTSLTPTWTRSLCVMIHQKLGWRVFCVYELWAHLRKMNGFHPFRTFATDLCGKLYCFRSFLLTYENEKLNEKLR